MQNIKQTLPKRVNHYCRSSFKLQVGMLKITSEIYGVIP